MSALSAIMAQVNGDKEMPYTAKAQMLAPHFTKMANDIEGSSNKSPGVQAFLAQIKKYACI